MHNNDVNKQLNSLISKTATVCDSNFYHAMKYCHAPWDQQREKEYKVSKKVITECDHNITLDTRRQPSIVNVSFQSLIKHNMAKPLS